MRLSEGADRLEETVTVFSPLAEPRQLYLGRETLNVARRVATGETVLFNPLLYQNDTWEGRPVLTLRENWRDIVRGYK